MYAVGTPILYARTSVCRIEDIGPAPFQEHNEQRYYKLRAVFSTSGERIYIPVNAAVSMRPLIDSGEAVSYLEQLPQLKPQLINFQKPAELVSHYQKVLSSGNPGNLLLLIKEIHLKGKELAAHNKSWDKWTPTI